MKVANGASLFGLLGSLLDGDSTADLAKSAQDLLDFFRADHRWSVNVVVKHDPKRASDD